MERLEQRHWALLEARITSWMKTQACLASSVSSDHTPLLMQREERTLLIPWLGQRVGLIGERSPNCSCLCRLCFIALLYFHHSVSMASFVSSGILSLLPCGFLTRTCFKIPCHTLRKNVRPGGWPLTPASSLRSSGPLPTPGSSNYFQSQQFPVTGISRWFSTRGGLALRELSGSVCGHFQLL